MRLKRPNPLEDIPVSHLKQLVASSTAVQLNGQRSEWPTILHGWLDLVELGRVANRALHSLHASTLNMAKDGRHDGVMHHFAQSVSQWWQGFQTMNGV